MPPFGCRSNPVSESYFIVPRPESIPVSPRRRRLPLLPLVGLMLFHWVFPSPSAAIDNLIRLSSIGSPLSAPTAVALDGSGGLYVTESGKNRLLVYNPSGVFLSELKGLDKPLGVAVDGVGRIYVCNSGRKNVEVYGSGLNLLLKLGAGDGEFILPVGVAIGNSGNIYVADAKACVVKVYRSDGVFLFSFGGSGNDDGKLNFPTSISIDPATEEVIVSDCQLTMTGIKGARIQVFDKNGSFRRKFGSFGQGEGLLMKPVGTAVDTNGKVYVSDAYQHIVEVYDVNGVYQKTVYDTARPMRTPMGIAIDRSAGKLYVASLNTSTVEVYGSGATGVGSGTLTFSRAGGSGCSAARPSSGPSGSPSGFLFPLAALSIYLRFRGKFSSCARKRGGSKAA